VIDFALDRSQLRICWDNIPAYKADRLELAMNPKPISEARDEDARNAMAAMLRAAQRAREIAAQTGTGIIIVRDGKLIREMPGDLKQK
jgi:hypothetical protein